MTRVLTASTLALLALGTHIWTHDRTWRAAAPEAPALLAVFPLVWLLGRPWTAAKGPPRASVCFHTTALAAALLTVGAVLSSTLALAAGWACLLRVSLAHARVSSGHPRPDALYVLAATGFPWLATDLGGVSWHLRTAAAAATAWVLGGLGVSATASGPLIELSGLTLHVDQACSGLGALQTLIVLAAVLQALPGSPRRAPAGLLAATVLLAFCANVLRLVVLAGLAHAAGVQAARGVVHSVAGLAVLLLPAAALTALAGPPPAGDSR